MRYSLKTKVIPLKEESREEDITLLKMVARKGAAIPQHILDKIKKIKMSDQKTIPEVRKKELTKIADFVSSQFSQGNITLLEDIVHFERLNLYIDHYEDAFDGMLVFVEQQFHIYVNIDRRNALDTNRCRFSLSHELAHYYINEHRIGLQSGLMEPHGSLTDLNKRDPIELEADYFAGCL